MAYDSLKALIRQYIKTNGEQEITGQILQNVLVEMVNQYPSTDGYATQSWVTSQGYATTSQLAGYLPLTGGTLSGNLTVLNASMSVVTAGSSATSYTATITGSGIEAQMLRSGTPINSRMVLNYGGLTFYDQNVAGTTITYNSVTSGSFIKSGGTSAQFLKADGSVDSNTYLTSASLADYLPLTGGTLSGNLTVLNASMSVVTAGSSATSYTATITGSGIEAQMLRSGTPINSRMVLNYGGLTFYDQNVAGTTITYNSVTSGSFIKSGGTSAQFLKADGSVDSNTYLTSASLADYLPLTGGTLSGNLTVLNASMSVVTAGSSATSYTATITGSGIEAQMLRSGTPINSRMVLNYGGLTFYDQNVAGTTITYNSVTSGSFIKSGGTSAQFLKADGSVDSNAYITASALTGYATQSWVTTQLASYNPTTNFKTINNQSIIGTGNINIEGGGGGAYYDAEIEYIQSSGTQYIDTGIYPSGKIRMVAHIKTTANNGVNSAFSGVVYTNATSVWQVIYPYNGVDFNVSREEITFNTVPYISEYTFDVNQVAKTVTLNGQTKYFTNTPTAMPAGHANIPLCKYQNEINPTNNGWYGKVYSVTIYDNDVLVRDFIPVRVGQVGYLYDKVSGELFGNSGTGDFVLGQDTGPGGGLPYLPLTGGTLTGNLTVNGTVKFNNNLTFAYDRGIDFGNNSVRINRDNSRLLIINEANDDIIIGDYDNRSYTSIANDLQGGTTDSTYRSVTGKWFIMNDGTAQFKTVSQTSDLRKKNIMGDVPINIYNVANAPLFKFTWNNETKYSGQHIGSAAQYWQTILPELVSIGRDADMTLAMQYDVIALASAITVAKTVVNHEERIILLERENEALRQEIADLKSA